MRVSSSILMAVSLAVVIFILNFPAAKSSNNTEANTTTSSTFTTTSTFTTSTFDASSIDLTDWVKLDNFEFRLFDARRSQPLAKEVCEVE
eukprot:gene4189-6535_t